LSQQFVHPSKIVAVSFGLIVLGYAAGFSGLSANQDTATQAADDAVLARILENTKLYCDKLQDFAYYFVCREAVTEVVRGATHIRPSAPPMAGVEGTYGTSGGTAMSVSDSSLTNNYLYEYQLIRKKGVDQETRTLLEKNGQKTVLPNARLEAMKFYFRNMAFGPIDLFGVDGQLNHVYKIVGSKTIKGQRSIIVEAAPKSDSSDYNPSGKVWIRERDCAILKIEWDQRSLFGFRDIQDFAAAAGAVPVFTLVSEYEVEKNGIRFPSRVVLREAYLWNKTKRKIVNSEVTIDYKDYQFFQVDVEVKY
jgi:hypothetical protein